MFKRTVWRPLIATVVLAATILLFVNYFSNHPEVWRQLRHIALGTLAVLLLLYALFTGSLALINSAALRICKSRISARESLVLTMYSSVINFFGPLQSGPAFRALYLKQKHGVKLGDYTKASFIYYFFYALFSGMLLLSGVLKWWLAALLIIIILLILPINKRTGVFKDVSGWQYMALASLIQVGIMIIIYFVELRAVMPAVRFNQVLVYTGAANFALFVSLTPGAIGFRESFLLFSEKLHHINSSTIVAASTIDRAVYIVILLLSASIIFATHAHSRLKISTSSS